MKSVPASKVLSLVALQAVFCVMSHSAIAQDDSDSNSRLRVVRGLQAFYSFDDESGPLIKDRSGLGQPLNLRISNPKSVRRSSGRLEVRGKTSIRSDRPATRLNQAIRRSGELTVEAWIQPARTDQTGPARIVSISGSPNERNFTLGQDGDKFDVRLRTAKTSTNGIPSISTSARSLNTRLTHVIYTRDRSGRSRIFLNGQKKLEKNVGGNLSRWNDQFPLSIANEVSGDRQWLGTFHLVAIYNRDLSPEEVVRNFKAGPDGGQALVAAAKVDPSEQIFQDKVASILARNCFECHDSTTRKGELDLSRRDAAQSGGESGKVIVAGKPDESFLLESIMSDDMPADREPLSADEKNAIRQWISTGARWTVAAIDPAIYTHGSESSDVWVQRLTIPEYIATVQSTVGVDISKEAYELLPPDLRADGFSNTAYNLNIDLKHIESYAELAAVIVSRMDTVKFASRFGKSRKLTDNNMRDLISKMGLWVLRGPLDEREVVSYRGLSTTVASSGGGFEEAVGLILEAMLQSPRFIYRIENQRGDGSAWPVGEYELASRLSYIIWGSSPDAELLKAAENGSLSDSQELVAQVDRMLKDRKAVLRSRQFVTEWLNLDRLDNMRPNAEKFPDWDPKLASAMRDETLAFFEEIAWKQNRPMSDLLNAQLTIASPALAKHYGLKPKGESKATYNLSDVPGRGGLLTQASILTVGGDEASMVTRGLFVLHDLLRGVVKDPPPCVDTTPIPTKPGLTQRGIAESRIKNAACGGCHAKFEPLAFGLERFDGIGVYREKDKFGNTLRQDGKILFPGEAKSIAYQSSEQLMNLLAESERVRESMTWKMTQFAMGRPLIAADAPVVMSIHKQSQADGGTYASLIKAIVLSDLVQLTRTEIDE